MTPSMGVNVMAWEQLAWTLNVNVVAGVEWYRPGATRRIALLLNYYHGFNPYGQFFNQPVESVGTALYFTF